MASLSRAALRELITTRYVENVDSTNEEKNEVETARAGCSVLQPQRPRQTEDVIENTGEDVVLVEDESYRAIHRIDETPKLVAKQAVRLVRSNDEAVKVLRKIKATPAEQLRGETYNYLPIKWFNTTRISEFELAHHVLIHPNHRPHVFTMRCHHLEIEDVASLVLNSLLSEPRETGQCFARFAIKTVTDMPFQVLYSLLETMVVENDRIQMTDCVVFATLIDEHKNLTCRLKTNNCQEYGEREPELDEQGKLMSSRATITCSVVGKRHVQTQITYMNNWSKKINARNRYIELEQTVKCMNRRVLIAEEQNQLIEYETEDEMIPLSRGVAPVDDLIEFLKSGEIDDE